MPTALRCSGILGNALEPDVYLTTQGQAILISDCADLDLDLDRELPAALLAYPSVVVAPRPIRPPRRKGAAETGCAPCASWRSRSCYQRYGDHCQPTPGEPLGSYVFFGQHRGERERRYGVEGRDHGYDWQALMLESNQGGGRGGDVERAGGE